MRILGISAFYHDSAAALAVDGRIVAAAQQERWSRHKHDARFPTDAIRSCVAQANIGWDAIDRVVFYEKPFIKFERLLETYLAFAPRGFSSFRTALPVWIKEKLFQKQRIVDGMIGLAPGVDWTSRLLFSEHHLSHAASAFLPSPFSRAAILTMDGVGEWATTTLAQGDGNSIELIEEQNFPHSLGLLYSAFTYYLGFKVNSGEYKVMGLAPYGAPRFAAMIRDHLVELGDDGSIRLDLDYFDFCTGLRMTNAKFDALFGGLQRDPESPLLQAHMDLAASIQEVTETAAMNLARHAAKRTGLPHLCLAGGVALNCVANGKIARAGIFERLWIQPAAGDAGGAVGAALWGEYALSGRARAPGPGDGMQGGLLGPEFAQDEIERRLRAKGARFDVLDEAQMLLASVDALADGCALGWFQGRMEFGPRALGARSILADPRRPDTQESLNLKVKFRESFRPFAPAVLAEDAADWFDLDRESPYMLLVAPVATARRTEPAPPSLVGLELLRHVRSEIPAVTHVDYSARVQTVAEPTHPLFHRLLVEWKRRTGCPVLANTSFNVRGEPIVCTPEDAFACFMGSGIEALAIGRCFLRKSAQDQALLPAYASSFDPD